MNDRIHIFEFSHLLAWNFKLVACLLVSKGSSLLEQQFNNKVALGPWKWTIFNRNKGEKYHITWTHFFYRWRDFHSPSLVVKVNSPFYCFDLDSFFARLTPTFPSVISTKPSTPTAATAACPAACMASTTSKTSPSPKDSALTFWPGLW